MALKTVLMADTIHDNVHNLPATMPRVAGYVTGSKDIQWTEADFGRFARTVRINQFPDMHTLGAGHVLDVENRAWTIPGAVAAAKVREAHDRHTTFYISTGNHNATVNELAAAAAAAGLNRSTTFLWVANWSLSLEAATQMIGDHVDGYRIVAVQWASPSSNPHTPLPHSNLSLAEANADLSITDDAWLASPAMPPPPVATGLEHGILVTHTGGHFESRKVTSKDHGKSWLIV